MHQASDLGYCTLPRSREQYTENSDASQALSELLHQMEENDENPLRVDSIDHEVEGSDDDESYDEDDEREKEVPFIAQFTMNAPDLECLILPMETRELFRMFPSWQMVSLVNYPIFVKRLQGVMCAGDFGYKIMVNRVTDQQKSNIAKHLHELGVTVVPHSSRHMLTAGRVSVGLHVLARAYKVEG